MKPKTSQGEKNENRTRNQATTKRNRKQSNKQWTIQGMGKHRIKSCKASFKLGSRGYRKPSYILKVGEKDLCGVDDTVMAEEDDFQNLLL